jgi:CBS domain-containing protein
MAGVIGRPVVDQGGGEIGKLVDVVARWRADPYPPVTGIVVRVGGRRSFVAAEQIASFGQLSVRLRSARLDLRDFERREGEVLLARDVLDHQLVDVDGVQVIRAADLYLAPVAGGVRLVGVDVGMSSLLRRLGPARFRARATPERVIDWAAIEPFGTPVSSVRLRTAHGRLQRLRPGELADLLEDLGREGRQELLESLDAETAADALEEMDAAELETLLREAEPSRAAQLLSTMEPDEAIDALRDLESYEREQILDAMEPVVASRLRVLLEYAEGTAGGLMTSTLITASVGDSVAQVRERLREARGHRTDIDAVAVVDRDGKLVDDVTLFDLALASDHARMAELVGDVEPVVVSADAGLARLADVLTDSRRSSVVVTDSVGRPVGRILADDLVDALVPDRGRFRMPRLLQ